MYLEHFERPKHALQSGSADIWYHLGNVTSKRHTEFAKYLVHAVELYKKAIAACNVGAMKELTYRLGRGNLCDTKDVPTAIEMSERALQASGTLALFNLGNIYVKGGNCVSKDPMRAAAMQEINRRWRRRSYEKSGGSS